MSTVNRMHNPVRPTFNIATGPVKVTLALRPGGIEWLKQRAKIDTDSELARIIGYDSGQMSRIVAGTARPGPIFVAGVARGFGWHALKTVFEWVPVDRSNSRGAS